MVSRAQCQNQNDQNRVEHVFSFVKFDLKASFYSVFFDWRLHMPGKIAKFKMTAMCFIYLGSIKKIIKTI